MSASKLTLSPQVRDFAHEEGLSEQGLLDMVQRAAKVTAKAFNRRFHQYAFLVLGDEVRAATKGALEMAKPEPPPCPDLPLREGEFWVLEDHGPCDGQGCHGCRGCGAKWRRRSLAVPKFKTNDR